MSRTARARYWSQGRLEKHKVAHLVRYNGMTPEAATVLWRRLRRRQRANA